MNAQGTGISRAMELMRDLHQEYEGHPFPYDIARKRILEHAHSVLSVGTDSRHMLFDLDHFGIIEIDDGYVTVNED